MLNFNSWNHLTPGTFHSRLQSRLSLVSREKIHMKKKFTFFQLLIEGKSLKVSCLFQNLEAAFNQSVNVSIKLKYKH